MTSIVPVVEGDGDADALPGLLNRILLQRFKRYDIVVPEGKSKVVKTNGRPKLISKLERFLRHAQNKPNCGAILVLVDADMDCPVTLAQQLSQRCEQIGTRCPIQVVCAHRSYESWFLASLDTIRGHHSIANSAFLDCKVEEIARPKQWLTDQVPSGQAYKETTHQASFSRSIDLKVAYRNSRSFRRLCHAVEQLLDEMGARKPREAASG